VGIEQLKGFQLEAVNFGIAFYTLDFQGDLNNEPRSFHVGTNYNLSSSLGKLEDAGDEVSKLLWSFLGQTLNTTTISETEEYIAMTFLFENKESFVIWQEKGAVDNLIIVRDPYSDEWFSVL